RLLIFWTGNKDHAVCLETLHFTQLQEPLGLTGLVDQHPPQAKPRGAALLVSHLNETAGTLEDLGGEFAAIFAGHGALDAFDDVRGGATVVLELLSAIMDRDAGTLADIFVVTALVGVLETAPTAHVVSKDALERGLPRLD